MSARRYSLLFLCGLLVAAVIAAFQGVPGYMDADYYYIGGQHLAAGEGLSEMVLWNYLDDPAGLPHPSHTYWMPLTSVFTALGIQLLPFMPQFEAAQVVFILLTALVPPITATFAYKLLEDQKLATLAGLLAALPGFYSAFYPTTDAFVLVTLLGGLFFWRTLQLDRWKHFLMLGVLAGLLHMARADGLMWLAVIAAAIYYKRQSINPLSSNVAALVGYLLVAAPWLWRNLTQFGTVMPPGGSAGLWLLDYDELYTYPATILSFTRWQQAGIAQLLTDRGWAWGLNLLTALAVQGEIFLGPLALIGAWQLRKKLTIKLGWLAWGLVFAVMTLVFPFPGARGGFFHSGAAFMPLVWTLAPLGLKTGISWMAGRRKWQPQQAWRVFSMGLLALAMVVTVFTAVNQLRAPWDGSTKQYQQVEAHLRTLGAQADHMLMVNNPPTYYAVTQRPAIVIPHGNLDNLMQAAARYRPDYLILDANNAKALGDLYQEPQDYPGLNYLGAFQDFQIYAFEYHEN